MKRRPTHPGVIIKEDYLTPLSMTVEELASLLGVLKNALAAIIDEKGAITPDMALRLSKAFDTTPDLWMNLQQNHDLWEARNSSIAWQSVQPVTSWLSDFRSRITPWEDFKKESVGAGKKGAGETL